MDSAAARRPGQRDASGHHQHASADDEAGATAVRGGPGFSPTRGLAFRQHPVVEVAGIEPASLSNEPGLLRAQLARRSLGSCTRASTLQTSPVSVDVPVKP